MHFPRFARAYFRLPVLLKLLGIITILMLVFGVLIHLLEPKVFPTIFEGIWWAFVTGSTVGYGDYVPTGVAGKITAMAIILAGGGTITFYMAIVSAATVKHAEKRMKGTIAFRGKKHLIIVGWNERTKNLIALVQENHPEVDIVLIDQTLKRLPEDHPDIHFIRGDPTADQTLIDANSAEAHYAIITADPGKQERIADQASILTTIAFRGNNDKIKIITEILIEEQVMNAKRAGSDQIIHSNHWLALLSYNSAFHSDNEDDHLKKIKAVDTKSNDTKT
ncbi:voltage-gated potassium channel [Natronobacillus azotifigens]|uniref:Potassium channel family protein n=1 Tax=Natronobacillus azotifigens TaxID=472978 RepID=A0A9J6RF32_9BACI|nr:potassium channel family protein [Natronobacillus azotifigens]MCZ0704248.1 potassium channel family protein [Natronobacillus azotifigens]